MKTPEQESIAQQQFDLQAAREALQAEQRDLQAIAKDLKLIDELKASNAKLRAENEAKLRAHSGTA